MHCHGEFENIPLTMLTIIYDIMIEIHTFATIATKTICACASPHYSKQQKTTTFLRQLADFILCRSTCCYKWCSEVLKVKISETWHSKNKTKQQKMSFFQSIVHTQSGSMKMKKKKKKHLILGSPGAPPTPPFFCEWLCHREGVCVCLCIFMWREKRKMYCIHSYFLPGMGVLWILCVITDRACVCVDLTCVSERGIPSPPFLPSLFTWFLCAVLSSCCSSRVSGCCIVIHEPSVQKSIEYKFNKISLFIASVSDVEALSIFFVFFGCFYGCVCFTPCSVVYFAVWMFKSRTPDTPLSNAFIMLLPKNKEKKKTWVKKRHACLFGLIVSGLTNWFRCISLSSTQSDDALCSGVII